MSYNWKCCSFYPNKFDASALSLSLSEIFLFFYFLLFAFTENE